MATKGITGRFVALLLIDGEFGGRKVTARVRARQSHLEQRSPRAQMLERLRYVHRQLDILLLLIDRLGARVPEKNLAFFQINKIVFFFTFYARDDCLTNCVSSLTCRWQP